MRVVPNLVGEFDEICFEYSKVDQAGKDIVALTKLFGDENDAFDEDTDGVDFHLAWSKFLDEHKHQMTIPMVGMVIYLLVTYWPQGQRLFRFLPPLEKMLARDTVAEISDEIERRSDAEPTG